MKGLMFYYDEDYEKNHWFAVTLVKEAKSMGIELDLIIREEFTPEEIDELCEDKDLKFIINRTRDYKLAKAFEDRGVRSFNNSEVARICNDKWETYSLASGAGIRMQKTKLLKKTTKVEKSFSFPMIIKSLDGHGGSEVFMIEDLEELLEKLAALDSDILIQKPADVLGKDLRVYVMGKRILGAVLRSSDTDFKANVSLGGDASAYELSEKEKELVLRVAELLDFDYVGIDFLLDSEGNLILNEIEDVVGSRSVYKLKLFDPINEYLKHIKSSILLD